MRNLHVETNQYKNVEYAVDTAIRCAARYDEVVTIDNAEGLHEQLLGVCRGHDGSGLYWGIREDALVETEVHWQIRVIEKQ